MRYETLPDGRHAWMVKTETRPGEKRLFLNFEGDDRPIPFTEAEEFAFSYGKLEAINARAFHDFQARARQEQLEGRHRPGKDILVPPDPPVRRRWYQELGRGFRASVTVPRVDWYGVGGVLGFLITFTLIAGTAGAAGFFVQWCVSAHAR